MNHASPSRSSRALWLALGLLASSPLAGAGEPGWRKLGLPADPRCRAHSMWVDATGRELFVGCFASTEKAGGQDAIHASPPVWIAHSTDGGASFRAPGSPLPLDSRFVSPVSAIWGRSGRDVWAVGNAGSIWHSVDGDQWTRSATRTRDDLFDIAGNDAGLVLAVGERGTVLASRDGRRFTREGTGTRANLRAVWVDSDGRAIAVTDRADVLERTARGRWRRRMRLAVDVLSAIAESGDGSLIVLSTRGRLLRSTNRGHDFVPLADLPLASRSSCDELAIDGRRVTVRCQRAAPGAEMTMEPAMQPYLLVAPGPEGPWTEEKLPGGISSLWARPGSGVTWSVGDGVWIRAN